MVKFKFKVGEIVRPKHHKIVGKITNRVYVPWQKTKWYYVKFFTKSGKLQKIPAIFSEKEIIRVRRKKRKK